MYDAQSAYDFLALLRATPAATSVLAFGPAILAAGQLLNSYVNGVSPVASVAFAVVMLVFAVVATGHHAAEHRLRALESTLEGGRTEESSVRTGKR